MYASKVDTLVDFPINGLVLKNSYCCDGGVERHCTTNEQIAYGDTRNSVYDLYSVVNHYGTLSYGHYTSVARGWLQGKDVSGDLDEDW